MDYSGTSWEGVKWKSRPVPITEFGEEFKLAVKDINKRAAMLASVVLLPLIAMLIIALAASPAAAGSCSVWAVRPGHWWTNPRGEGVAQCRNPGGHRHYMWVQLKKDTFGWPNKTITANSRRSSQYSWSTYTRMAWAGPGNYYTRMGVRWQGRDVSRNVWWWNT